MFAWPVNRRVSHAYLNDASQIRRKRWVSRAGAPGKQQAKGSLLRTTHETRPTEFWVGGEDRRLALFENLFPIPQGIATTAIVSRMKTWALIETVDASISQQFLENAACAQGHPLDYPITQHMEPDHCANIESLLLRYPHLTLWATADPWPLSANSHNIDITGFRTGGWRISSMPLAAIRCILPRPWFIGRR